MSAPSPTVFVQGTTTVSADHMNTFVQTVASFTQLRGFTGTSGMSVFTQGSGAPGDGYQGSFYWNAVSSATDDGVNTIAPYGATIGRWLRLVTYANPPNIPINPVAPSPLITSAATVQVNLGNYYYLYVATGASATYVFASTTVFGKYAAFEIFAVGGPVTVTIQPTDTINGGTAGAGMVINQGYRTQFNSDGAGNWWVSSTPTYGHQTGTGSFALGNPATFASGTACFAAAGGSASGIFCASIGSGNASSGSSSAVYGGYNNSASGTSSVILGGNNNTSSGLNSVIIGGYGNSAPVQGAFVAGYNAVAQTPNQNVWSSGWRASAGDTQASMYTLSASTVNTSSLMYISQSTGYSILINSGQAISYRVLGIARDTVNQAHFCIVQSNVCGAITNISGSITHLTGTFTYTSSAGTGTLSITPTIVGGALSFIAASNTANQYDWTIRVETAEVE